MSSVAVKRLLVVVNDGYGSHNNENIAAKINKKKRYYPIDTKKQMADQFKGVLDEHFLTLDIN